MTEVWAQLRDVIERHGRAAMVTVAAAKGSVPREAGARLVVQPDGGFFGTIGGGTLEWKAIAIAQAMLGRAGDGMAELRPFVLGPDMGQCCGGQVDLLFEVMTVAALPAVEGLAAHETSGAFVTRGRIDAGGVARQVDRISRVSPGHATLADRVIIEGFGDDRRPVIMFGAGHVGRALVMALAPLPFAVRWVDPRPDAFPALVPANVATSRLDDPEEALVGAAPGSFVLVMSHSHQLDLAIVGAALADDRFPYVGLIGSKSKRMRFERRLASAGIGPGRIADLVCPIGVAGIDSKMPAAIAAATAAELLVRDEAIRRAIPRDAEIRGRAGAGG